MSLTLVHTFIEKHPEEAAALIEGSAIPEVESLFKSLDNRQRVSLIPYLSLQYMQKISHLIDEEIILDLSRHYSTRVLFNVFSVFSADKQEKYISALPKRAQWYLKYAHKHHDKYIATLMTSEYLSLIETMTVEQAWHALRQSKHKVSIIFTHDEEKKRLSGQISLERIYATKRSMMLRDLAEAVKYSQTPFTPITNITQHNIWRHYDIIPIVDHERRLLGVIQTKAIYEEILKDERDTSIAFYDTIESLVHGFYSIAKTLYRSGSKD